MSATLTYRCAVCDTAYAEVANEQATLDPRFAIGYCLECSSTQQFRVDVTAAPVQGVVLGDVVDSDTDTRPGNVYNGPGRPEPRLPDPEPEAPTYPDQNSREAAQGTVRTGALARRRRRIARDVQAEPGVLSCSSWCEDRLAHDGHGAVSGCISGLWSRGVLDRVGKRRNRRGRHEYVYALAPALADADLTDLSLWADLDRLVERFGL